MNDIIDIEAILQRKDYGKIYKFSFIIIIILIILIFVSFIYKYQTYYEIKGRGVNNQIEILIPSNDIKYFYENTKVSLNGIIYDYQIINISEYIYKEESLVNYQYIYLKIDNLNIPNNFICDLQIKKEFKNLASYLFKN